MARISRSGTASFIVFTSSKNLMMAEQGIDVIDYIAEHKLVKLNLNRAQSIESLICGNELFTTEDTKEILNYEF
jgi:hypothetical protein